MRNLKIQIFLNYNCFIRKVLGPSLAYSERPQNATGRLSISVVIGWLSRMPLNAGRVLGQVRGIAVLLFSSPYLPVPLLPSFSCQVHRVVQVLSPCLVFCPYQKSFQTSPSTACAVSPISASSSILSFSYFMYTFSMFPLLIAACFCVFHRKSTLMICNTFGFPECTKAHCCSFLQDDQSCLGWHLGKIKTTKCAVYLYEEQSQSR